MLPTSRIKVSSTSKERNKNTKENNIQKPKKPLKHHLGKQHRVEMLHDSKTTKEPPIIKICSEIPNDCRSSENKFESIIPTTSGKLTEPSFQSSLMVLKNLECLKKAQVDSQKLLKLNLNKDHNLRKFIDNKVSSVVNSSPHQQVFTHLPALAPPEEELSYTETSKRQHTAEVCGPKKNLRDEELSLSTFLTPAISTRKPVLQHSDFLSLCHQYQINPFMPHIVKSSDLSVYTHVWAYI